MAEYIEREAAYNAIVRNYTVDDQLSDLDKIPSADVVAVRHGKWVVLDDCSNEGVYCSACHKKVYRINYSNTMKMRSKFCPNCGALMDDKDGDGDV